jgi:CRISPR-associated protein Cas1
MQLVINTYGAYLHKKGDCFEVKLEDRKVEIPASKVDGILISTSAMVSTDAIQYAIENNIDIVFLDRYGDPYGRIWHSKMGSTALIRRRQLEASDSDTGTRLVKEWGTRKLRNQVNLLKKLKHTRPEHAAFLQIRIDAMERYIEELLAGDENINQTRNKIMGVEGATAKLYWEAISEIMPAEWSFNGRSRQPAQDPFNATLNYAYGVLYSVIEKSCIIAGLDPYVGILHTDNYNKKSFVFDAIEPYRVYADETVVFLFTRRQARPDFFENAEYGCTLQKPGKEALVKALNECLDSEETHRGRKMQVRNIIQAELHETANRLLEGY